MEELWRPTANFVYRHCSKNNYDSKIALSNIEEAALRYGITRKDMLPMFDIDGSWNRGNFNGGSQTRDIDESTYIGAQMSWEIDFWGRLRRANESQRAQLMATHFFL